MVHIVKSFDFEIRTELAGNKDYYDAKMFISIMRQIDATMDQTQILSLQTEKGHHSFCTLLCQTVRRRGARKRTKTRCA